MKMTTEMMEKEIDSEKICMDYVRKINCQENHKQTEYVDYYLQEFKTKLYSKQLNDNKEIILKFIELKFTKFQRIFQIAFYLLGKDKNEVNVVNSNIFNWRKFKESSNIDFFNNLDDYQYQGMKEGEFKKYNKVDQVVKMLKAIDAEQVKSYSFPFYLVYRLVYNLCQLRLSNIKKRREEIQVFNKIREMKLD